MHNTKYTLGKEGCVRIFASHLSRRVTLGKGLELFSFLQHLRTPSPPAPPQEVFKA